MLPNLENIEVEKINVRQSDNKNDKRTLNVDMNPMVDLAFLLLTFFMLATTFSKPQAMELLIPAKPKDELAEKEMAVKESKTLSIALQKDQVQWYRGITEPKAEIIKYEDLESLLSTINNNTEGLVVLIKPLGSSKYSNLVDVLDALNYSNIQRYAISDLSEFDESLELNSRSDE
ncbi:MAG TPA: biopolymer transporter ExbD [Flavobacteriales bacterium]|jgi:biopolymer transport protein ExbD|nr:biopolymer transporter ExbD [Flavobacteriales bacterium]